MLSPYGGILSSDGQLLPKNKKRILHVIDPIKTGITTYCQLNIVVNQAIKGTKINWPAANAEVSMPVTNPLLLLNHRVAMAADNPNPKMPEATPKQMPILI